MSERFRASDPMRHAPMSLRLAHAGGDWVAGLPKDQLGRDSYDTAADLTFRNPCGPESARRTLQHFAQHLADKTEQRVGVAYAIEGHGSGDAHIHALFAGERKPVSVKRVQRSWWLKAGYPKAERYDPTKGGAYYLSKGGEPDWFVASPTAATVKGGHHT